MTIMLGDPIEVRPDKRLHDHVMDAAMGDVIDALVELITNADDSYGHKYRAGVSDTERGKIVVERFEQRGGQASYLTVRDWAEGMSLERIVEVFQRPGALTSEVGDRGYMGRGAKDCARFGQLTIESIRDNRYSKCVLSRRATEIIPVEDIEAGKRLRKTLGIPSGNGTIITLEIGPEFKVPQIMTLAEELSCHYALQDILHEASGSRLVLRNGLRPDDRGLGVVAPNPDAETICEREPVVVDGYDNAVAYLSIYRACEPFDERPMRTRQYGFLIAGGRAIHERSQLAADIERDPNSRRYFGRIECEHINVLLHEYERRRFQRIANSLDNPRLLIDPGRRYGLEKDHPFTKALFREPIQRLRALLEKDRKERDANRKEMANNETSRRLDRLAKAASRFLREHIDDLEDLGVDEDVDEDSFVKQGMLIYPTFLNVQIGQELALTVYVNQALLNSNDNIVEVTSDNRAIEVIGTPLVLRPHKSKPGRLVGSFKVKGCFVASDIGISARCNGLPQVQALAQVVEATLQNREFQRPLEFERDEYRIRSGASKGLKLFANYPDVIDCETLVFIENEGGDGFTIPKSCRLKPVVGTNYAVGELRVEAKRLHAKTAIVANLEMLRAETRVKAVKRHDRARGPQIRFELRDQDFGNFRALWANLEGRPNVLLIAGRHKSLTRYLGQTNSDGKFPGQENPLYRVLLAEIVAEAVCRKSLQLEASERPWDFQWAQLKDDDKISDDVISQLQQRLREFLPIAHREMVHESDARKHVIIDP